MHRCIELIVKYYPLHQRFHIVFANGCYISPYTYSSGRLLQFYESTYISLHSSPHFLSEELYAHCVRHFLKYKPKHTKLTTCSTDVRTCSKDAQVQLLHVVLHKGLVVHKFTQCKCIFTYNMWLFLCTSFIITRWAVVSYYLTWTR